MYSIGETKSTTITSFKSNEAGNYSAVFIVPQNTFHTGQRVVRISNSVGGNLDSATTYADGSSVTTPPAGTTNPVAAVVLAAR